jgi:hypothetical protein
MKILARAYYELSPEQRQRQSELGRKVIKREQLWWSKPKLRPNEVDRAPRQRSYRQNVLGSDIA